MHALGVCMLVLLSIVTARNASRPVPAPQLVGPKLASAWFTMPLDHFNQTDNRTFANRFWYNDEFYQQGGPVFFYNAGESGLDDADAAETLDKDGVHIYELAKEFHGLAVYWEHRFYGESQPFVLDRYQDLPIGTTAAYQFHTVEQALEDTVYFANNVEEYFQGRFDAPLHPFRTPWIFVGGSYPGALAAWARVRNPEVWYASWASSAIVQTLQSNPAFYNPISRALPQNCSNDMAVVTAFIDDALESSNADFNLDVRKRLNTALLATAHVFDDDFDASQINETSNDYYAQTFFTVPVMSFQYTGPAHEHRGIMQDVCDAMESWSPKEFEPGTSLASFYIENTAAAASANGIAGTYSAKDALDAFLHAHIKVYKDKKSREPGIAIFPSTVSSWVWQVRKDLGLYIDVTPEYFTDSVQSGGSQRIVSKFCFNNGSYSEHLALEKPGIEFPERPDSQRLIDVYGGWDMNPSHVMFTSGEHDPWSSVTVLSVEMAVGAPGRNFTSEIPACEMAPSYDTVFGQVYEKAAHCNDLYNRHESKEAAHAQDLFTAALRVWLPCFGGKAEQQVTP